MRKLIIIFLSITLFASCKFETRKQLNGDLPMPVGNVNDFEVDLCCDGDGNGSMKMVAVLDSTIEDFKSKTGNEIAIVTVSDISPYPTLEAYAKAIGNHWGVGKKDKNNGLVIAVSKARREVWIQTGTGMEGKLNNAVIREIIDQQMVPQFSKENYFDGIRLGLNAIITKWDNNIPASNDSIH